jgi:hypothetical protein
MTLKIRMEVGSLPPSLLQVVMRGSLKARPFKGVGKIVLISPRVKPTATPARERADR